MTCDAGWHRREVLAGLLTLAFAGCDDRSDKDYQPDYTTQTAAARNYRFGCPFAAPAALAELYQPLLDYLNAHLDGAKLELEAARDYESFEQKLYYRNLDFALANPYQMLMGVADGYHIFAKLSEELPNSGLILLRKDSPITEVTQLKGQVISYPADTALFSTILPQAFLHRQGLDVQADTVTRYVGSDASSILSVYMGRSAAGCAAALSWSLFQQKEPAKAAELQVKWQTGSLPNNGWVARADVSPQLVDKLRALLVGLSASEEGRALLKHTQAGSYEAADDHSYAEVQAFLRRFNETVRPVALP